MKPTANMLRRPDLTFQLGQPTRAAPKGRAAKPSTDPVAERRSGLVRALEETVAERRDETIVGRVEERLEQRSQALVGDPTVSPGRISARWVGYDKAADCEPVGRLPLADLRVRLVIGDQKAVSLTTGPAGLVHFEVPEEARGSYLLEATAANGEVFASAEGDLVPGDGAAHLVEVGSSRELEPAFARGRNLILAADRAAARATQIAAKVERALARQEESLRKEIAVLDAMLANTKFQGKGETDGTDAQDQERRR